MATNSIAQKLRIRENMNLLAFHAPDHFMEHLAPLPAGVQVTQKGEDYQQIHWFVKNRAGMEAEMEKIIGLLKGEVVCWIYYPKGSSHIQTDLTRDKGWEKLSAHDELKWISLVSFDDTWSVFGMRLKTAADTNKEAAAKPRAIFEYIDAAAKTIRLPGDLQEALQANGPATQFFDSLSFSNKKEYVEWIVSAKREETRKQRVQGTIEKLENKWKNPRNL
ncbi:MAG: YdeI/OmpD-associated family protein [Williamsia sp.]|nr:YdeI/OmpD-associated family protein [Williamsia sp.]